MQNIYDVCSSSILHPEVTSQNDFLTISSQYNHLAPSSLLKCKNVISKICVANFVFIPYFIKNMGDNSKFFIKSFKNSRKKQNFTNWHKWNVRKCKNSTAFSILWFQIENTTFKFRWNSALTEILHWPNLSENYLPYRNRPALLHGVSFKSTQSLFTDIWWANVKTEPSHFSNALT